MAHMASAAQPQQSVNASADTTAAVPSANAGAALNTDGAVPHDSLPQQQRSRQQQQASQRQQQGMQQASEDVDWWVEPGAGSSEDYSSEDEQALGLETAPPDFYDPAADDKVRPVVSARDA